MAKLSRKGGTTSQILDVFIQDSAVTTGAGKTGLAYNTASLVAYYVRPGAAAVAITLVTQTVAGAYSSGGFVEIDATNMPGMYRFDPPDAAGAAGVGSVAIMLKGATGMAPCTLEIELTAVDNQDAVRGGMTALPASGTLEVNPVLAATQTGVTIPTVTALTNAPSDSSGVTTLLGRIVGTLLTGSHNPQTGDAFARLGVAGAGLTALGDTRVANLDVAVSTRLAPAGTLATVTNLTNAPTAGDLTAAMKASVTTAVPTVAAIQSGLATPTNITAGTITTATNLTTNNDKTGYALSAAGVQAVWDALTTALTTVGSIGKRIADYVDAAISSRLAPAGTLATVTALTNAPTDMALNSTVAKDATVMKTAGYTAPDNTSITAIKAKTDNLPAAIKKNVALANFEFLMVLATDHVTAATGLTITATRSIDGAAFAACANAASEVSGGIYKIDLAAADLNGDVITFSFSGGATADIRIITVVTQA